jgi:hypothetical protein
MQMKKTNLFLLVLFVLVASVSCKQEEINVEYNFSALGLKQLIVNNEVLNLDSCGFPLKDNKNFLIVGSSGGSSIRRYDLAVWCVNSNEKNISIISKYNDTLAEIEINESAGYCNVIVSRSGFKEKLVYKVGFLIKPVE